MLKEKKTTIYTNYST